MEEGTVVMWDAMGWAGLTVMSLVMVGFWVLVAAGIAALFRPGHRTEQPVRPRSSDPWGVLDERLARGEIGIDEYRAQRGGPASARPSRGTGED
ncbi:SHOCT domain-containing protein [Rhodococcus zopfii]